MKFSAAAFALAATAATVSAQNSTQPYFDVFYFSEPYFNGAMAGRSFPIKGPCSFCYPVEVLNDAVFSARWNTNVPTKTGTITFTEHANCTGKSKTWSIPAKNFPANFEIDGLKNMISGVRITL
ncbi:hypothetical protein GQ42DRAFT_161459 [Ramicandelaber brevisporus]|nr:hypothetical protein GQ42DRAFT_161459 [Ramicandelaber brevisporus]